MRQFLQDAEKTEGTPLTLCILIARWARATKPRTLSESASLWVEEVLGVVRRAKWAPGVWLKGEQFGIIL